MNRKENFTTLLDEIIKIRQLLEMLAKDSLRKELEEVVTTAERRKMWRLFNGFLNTKEIAEKVGVSQRAVQIFVKELQAKDLVFIVRRGYPKRKFDYIPSDWKIE